MDPCGSAKELSKSIWLKRLIIGKSVLCFVSAIGVLYLLFKKATRWIPHPNAKVLYLNHLLWSILVPLAFGSCYGFDSVRLSIFHENPCDYTLTTGFILKTRLIPVTCLNIQSTTMLAFAIERVYSTLYPLNYEAVKSPRLGVLMIILSIVGVVAFECSTMFINVDWEQPLALYSIKTRTNAYYYQLSLYTFAAIELAAILLFSLALWKNHRMFKQYKVASVNSLRIKYQITENRQLIQTLLPCFVFHFLLSFSTYVSIALYPVFFPVFDVVSFGIWLETASQSNLYSLVMPVILISTLKKQEQRTVVDTTPQIDTYFAQFQKMDDTCQKAFKLSQSFGLRFLLFGKMIISYVAAGAIVYLFVKKRTQWIPHPNAKVLYLAHLLWSFLVPSAYGTAFGFDFMRLSPNHQDHCKYTISTTLIFSTRPILIIIVYAQSMTMFAFAIERAVSTIIPTTYETVKNNAFGLVLSLSSGAFVIIVTIPCLFVNVNWVEQHAVFSAKTEENGKLYEITVYFFACVELAAVIIFGMALIRNDQIHKHNLIPAAGWTNNLKFKYQIAENRRLINNLLPCFLVHFVLTALVYFGIILYSIMYDKEDTVTYGFWLEVVSHNHVYSMIMPILLFRSLRKHRSSRVVNQVKPVDTYFAHFQQILENVQNKSPR